MNARRVHELMQKHFPPFDSVSFNWTIVADQWGPRTQVLTELLNEHVPAAELVVHVHRQEGAFVPRAAAVEYIATHIGQGQIRVADRRFTSFLVVALNGVAAGWAGNDALTANCSSSGRETGGSAADARCAT